MGEGFVVPSLIRRTRFQPAGVVTTGVAELPPKASVAIITSPATVPVGFLKPPGRTAKILYAPASPPSVISRLVTVPTAPAAALLKYAIEVDMSAPAPPAAARVRA